ncbi:MAG: DUF6009 family protein [Pirellulaceae bacterium]
MVKTRSVRYPDGRCEIIRVLSADDLADWSDDDPLSYEKSVVWLEDVTSLPYVRVAEVRCARSRRGRLRLSSRERVVGYSKLMADAPRDPATKRFTRRLFYLKDTDVDSSEDPAPEHAVDPGTVLPGTRGKRPASRRHGRDPP